MQNRDQILKSIGAIGRAAKKLTADVQTCAVACVLHAVKHGDVTLADQLVDVLGKGLRRASLRAWFETNGPMYLPKGKDKFAFDAERRKTLAKEVEVDLEARLMEIKWEEAKPEEPVVSVFDVSDAVDKFLKRLERQVKEANVEIKHRDLFALLQQQVSIYHAEEVLGTRQAPEAPEAVNTVEPGLKRAA